MSSTMEISGIKTDSPRQKNIKTTVIGNIKQFAK